MTAKSDSVTPLQINTGALSGWAFLSATSKAYFHGAWTSCSFEDGELSSSKQNMATTEMQSSNLIKRERKRLKIKPQQSAIPGTETRV
jgi:K+-transporting ATPase c subunit